MSWINIRCSNCIAMVQFEPGETTVECKFCASMISSGTAAQTMQSQQPLPVPPAQSWQNPQPQQPNFLPVQPSAALQAKGQGLRSTAIGLGTLSLLLAGLWILLEWQLYYNPTAFDVWINYYIDLLLAGLIFFLATAGLAAAGRARKHHCNAKGAITLSWIALFIAGVCIAMALGV